MNKARAIVVMIVALCIGAVGFWVLPLMLILQLILGGFLFSFGVSAFCWGLGELYSICG